MMSFYLSGGVEVLGFISPTEPTDEYPVIDPLYGIDGFRNVNTLTDLNNIPNLRRRAGMVVGIGGGTQYYKLNPGPWNGTITDWTIFNSGGGSFTGGTVTGDTIFTQGVTATTFSASTYLGLPLDVYVTGGTYSNGVLSFTNNSGDTFNISGLYTGDTDFYVTGGTFDKNTETLTLERNDGNNVQITGFTDIFTTGFTFNPSNYNISVELNDGTTLTQNLGVLATDVTITGGTYDPLNGSVTFVNNTGGTFTVSGFITGFTDIQVTGYTYQDNTFTISDSSGNTFSTTIDTVTGLTVNGDLISNNFSGTTNYIPKFTPNSYSLGNSIITNNSNNVSVGTISTPYRFYVLGNNTTAGQPLFVVRDTGRIGINTTSPNAELSIQNTNPATSQDILTLRNNGTGIGTGNSVRFINSTSSSSTVGSKIESIITNLSGRNSLKFYVHGGGGSFGALQERMVIDGTGNIFANQFNGLTVSATTYQNLPLDVYVTGGTYSNGTIVFTNNSGSTFNVTGLYTGQTSYVNSLTTGAGLSADTTTGDITIINTDPDQIVTLSGGTGILTGGTYPNFTIENSLPDQTVVLNNGSNISVTGTYPNFTVNVTGLTDNDKYVTGFTYQDNTFTISDNSGSTFNATINTVTGLTVNGVLTVTTISAATYSNLPLDIYVTGGTYNFTGNTLTLNSNDGNNISITGFTYERQSDYVYPYFYGGSAPLYTLTSTSTWIIKRVDYTTPGSPITLSAIGSWDNRYILIYT